MTRTAQLPLALGAVALCFGVFLAGCGDDGAAADPLAEATSGHDVAPAAAPAHDGRARLDIAEAGPPGLGDRGFTQVRVIVHLHSAFSHDGCDDEGLDEDGQPNWPCIRRMKAALCAEHIAVAFMTDHPSFMEIQTFSDLFYAEPEAGDELVADADGAPWAVAFACPDGEGGPDGRAWLVPGFEGHHTMPIGIRKHLDMAHYDTKFVDSTPDEALLDLTSATRAAGGRVTIAHSEEDDISAELIAAHDVTGMELYNFHANFVEVLGSFSEQLFQMDAFLDDAPGHPDSDLVALLMLDTFPVDALTKWRHASAIRPITPLGGSDVHENVVLPALCPEGLCDGIVEEYPHLVELLETGGNVMLGDGERIDSYGRVFRWIQNRLWVDGDADPVAAVEAALDAGRANVVFAVLGDAIGVELIAGTPEGALHDLGSTVSVSDGLTLWARSPDDPVPGRLASWSDGSPAAVTSSIWRTTAAGASEVIASWDGAGAWRSLPLDAPGSYHLEVTVVPWHVEPALGVMSERAAVSYRWVETGAILVVD